MSRSSFLFCLSILIFTASVSAQDVLRGRVVVDVEPAVNFYVEDRNPVDTEEACRRALEEASYLFSGQIYGWSFYYDIGERARNLKEEFNLEPIGSIPWGDSALKVTAAEFIDKGLKLEVWMDYRPAPPQQRRLLTWKQGLNRTAQAIGYTPMGSPTPPDDESSAWFAERKAALEDAARAAIRAMLRGSERNRPKAAHGYIGLHSFPRFFIDSGQVACSARFLVDVREIVPFSAY